jgi:hypothetical protein
MLERRILIFKAHFEHAKIDTKNTKQKRTLQT